MKDIVAEVPRLICTANYACRKELGQEAIYICNQCASLQCSKCESELHRISSNRTHHQRLKIDDLDDESCSCSMNSTHEATIFCNECEKKFCKNCFDKRHQQTDKRYHTPMIYQDDLRNKTEIRTMKVPSSTNDKHNETFEDVEVDTSDDSPNSPEYSSNQSPKRNHIDREMLAQSLLEMHDNQQDMNEPDVSTAFLLLDGNEALTVKNKSEFLQKLNVNDHAPSVKCVSIVGNTGHGKSYTLNQIFFNGKDVFRTSSAPDSCTMGVWASLDENQQALVLDTEGLLGQTANVRTRNRLLLKIMCLSDIIIYRINAPRLTNDMFEFLSEASKAFSEYFQKELESVLKNSNVNGLKSLPGPSLVIFHETHNTDVLKEDFKQQKTPVQQIKERFENMGLHYSSYQSIDYVGTRTSSGEKTNFEPIKSTITSILEDKNNRSLRSLSIFYTALKALNEKFSHTIPLTLPSTLLDDFFACNHKCLACGSKCSIVANHLKENLPHECNKNKSCIYNPDVDNEVWKCRACLYEGVHTIVYGKLITKNDGLLQGLIRYVWSGFVIECPKHGEIYRSRKYWYGNSDPRDVTQVDIIHVWQGEKTNRDASDVTPRKCMEILASAGSFLSAPTKIISQTITDQVAPSYWVPNKDAKKCANCSLVFGSDYSKHHCRSCGKVFCDTCSKKRRVVPWVDSESPVRVCDKCADKPEMDPPPSITSSVERNNQLVENNNSSASNAVEIPISRRVYETIVTGLEKINANYPIELLKDSARPNYWQPDHKCLTCVVCEQPFNNTTNRLHHCRNCGYGVCELCSPYKRCVPERDWFTPVRVCKNCNETMSEQTSERK